ncbi:MAG TPA: oligosaccharide flippase family protein [Solirubrobacteraceae bacterium]|nr:oligosaccharide flippase family protein [Solirubrobacteraceae bacterium]
MTSELDTAPPAAQSVAREPYAAGEAGSRVIRGGSLRVVGTLVGVLAGAVSAPLVVHHLHTINFGRYLTVTSVMFVVAAVTEGGLNNVAVRLYSASGEPERRSLIANLTGVRIVLGLLGGAAAIGFGLLAGYEHVLVVGLALGATGYLMGAIQGSYSVALTGNLRLTALAGIDTLRSLLTTILLISLVFAGSGLIGFYAVVVLVQGSALVVTALLVRRHVPLGPAFERSRWRDLLHETALYAVASTLGVVYFQVALITMSLLDPGHQTGYYAVAFRIVELVNGIPWLLAGSVLPVLAIAAATDLERLRYVAGRVFEGGVIAGGWFAIVIVLGAGFAIHVVAGAEGQPAIGVLRIMGIGVTATFLVSSWGFVLLSLRMHRALVLANASALTLAIALSAILIPILHARGAAITTAALELGLAGAYIAILFRRGIRPPPRFLARFVPAVGLGLGVGALALLVHPVVAVIVGSAVYFGALWLLRAIPSELIDALPSRR